MYGLLICLHGSALKSASRTAAVHIVAGGDCIGNHGYPAQLCILALVLCENDWSRQRSTSRTVCFERSLRLSHSGCHSLSMEGPSWAFLDYFQLPNHKKCILCAICQISSSILKLKNVLNVGTFKIAGACTTVITWRK